MEEKEIWKTIEEFPNYEISSHGRVRNKETQYILSQLKSKSGYMTIRLRKRSGDDEKPCVTIHRLVAKAFILNPEDKEQVNHIDGNKLNNHVKNLEWCTRKENSQHAMRLGLFKPEAPEPPYKRKVRIIETGEEFNSLSDCAKAIDGHVATISYCLNGKKKSHRELHFEEIEEVDERKPVRGPFLFDYQMDAVNRMHNGCILVGSVGSGKSRAGLFYYFKECGGWIDEYGYQPMKNPKDLIIITTAKKRDSLEWLGELTHYLLYPDENGKTKFGNTVIVESWNNIGKFKDYENAFFLLDEQRLVSYGSWTKTFLRIAKHNDWIMLSATPADTYSDYLPVFLANGYFRTKTEFNQEHVVFSRFTKYPKIDKYINTTRLDGLVQRTIVTMNYTHDIRKINEDVFCSYDISLYRDTIRNRWDYFNDEPLKDAGSLCYALRRIVNSDESRQVKLLEILENHPRAIIFYNYNYERDILLSLAYGEDVEVAEWTGHKHEPVPDSEKWVYICQYTSACEGWENTKTNCIIFYSQTYSYKVLTQAAGRVDRLNTPYEELFYYHLRSRSGIDLAITRALTEKRKFNEKKFAKWD